MTSCAKCTYNGGYSEADSHLRPWPCTECDGGELYQERGTGKKVKPLRVQVLELRARLAACEAQRDALRRALQFYADEDAESVEMGLLGGVEDRPATAALRGAGEEG